ncbi:hypothetical protein ACHAXA_002100 [Cyclostephanos tholiformis]|uniref:MYND-type domain-containing protein n=1 Tax=Cyclostephanos tholiformis TaxID=382380 RepID=A0ABD3ST20_9STRA
MASSAAPTTQILEEFKRLQEIQLDLANSWRDEVHLYEQFTSTSAFVGGVDDADNYHCGTRNHFNDRGTVEDECLFPYHTALYPLLDCYDSIEVVDRKEHAHRPSPTPMPFERNGHRRSRFSPRLDRHGVRIEELATINEHLPNSSWAIGHLMPRNRRLQYAEYEGTSSRTTQIAVDHPHLPVREEPDANVERETPPRHDNHRFWNILMDPVSEPVLRSDISKPPEIDSEWEDADDDEDDGSGHWENIDDEGGYGQNIVEFDESAIAISAKSARDFTFLRWWQHAIVNERRGIVEHIAEDEKNRPFIDRYSPESLFADSPSATMILLRVLKHSMSDLQRDFRLSQAVLLLIADWGLCEDNEEEGQGGRETSGIECLRRLLTIISSEYAVRNCGGYCHEWYILNGGISDDEDDLENSTRLHAPSHYCTDWWHFLGILSTLISEGIQYISPRHANVICAFVMLELNCANSCAGPVDDVTGGERLSGKAYLKRNLYFLNNAEHDIGTVRSAEEGLPQDTAPFNTNLLLTIVSAIRQHALCDRMRLAKLVDEMNNPDATCHVTQGDTSIRLSRCLDSFLLCVKIMVDIGERIAVQLPCNIHGRQLGGMLIRGLLESYIGSDSYSLKASKPLSYIARDQDPHLKSLIDPCRYAEAVAKSSIHPLLDLSRNQVSSSASGCSIEHLIGIQPPTPVIDTVKALFTADLVDLQVSGCGYGDFLIWCHLPISPEPLLFDYVSNFPNLSHLGEGESRNEAWVVDEDGIELDYAHLSARYDFSLLVFLRQWHAPWTPDSHLSFSIPFRRSISTLALCAHRFGVPHDIVALVNSFLPRSWWPDDRRCCWCRDCQMNRSKHKSQSGNWDSQYCLRSERKDQYSSLRSEKEEKPKLAPTLMTCSGCQVAMACSKEHMKFLHRDGHKRYCGRPPFRAPFHKEDNEICREVLGDGEGDKTNVLEIAVDQNTVVQEDENMDDGSWESVDSEEEVAEPGKSDVILAFFNSKSYKLQQRTHQYPFFFE